VLLLNLRVRIVVSYNNDFDVKIKYLFFTYSIKSKQEGKTKKAKKQKETQPKKVDLKSFLDTFKRFIEPVKKLTHSFMLRLRVDMLMIKLTVCSDDAAKTAILYGGACAVIYPAAAYIEGNFKVKKDDVSVLPDFNGKDSSIEFLVIISIKLIRILAESFGGAAGFIIDMVKENRTKKPAKGGAVK
jgi:nitrate reductase NapE component